MWQMEDAQRATTGTWLEEPRERPVRARARWNSYAMQSIEARGGDPAGRGQQKGAEEVD